MAKGKKSIAQHKKNRANKKDQNLDLMRDLPNQQLEEVQQTLSDSE